MDHTSPRAIAAAQLSPARLAGFALGIGAANLVVLLLASQGSGLPLFWPGNALALVTLLLHRPRHVPPVLASLWLGTLAARLLGTGDGQLLSAALATLDGLEVLVAWALLRPRSGRLLDLSRLPDLARFALAGALAAPLASGLAAGMLLWLGGKVPMLDAWQGWAAAHGLGMVLVLPLAFTLLRLNRPPALRRRATALDIAAPLLLAATAFAIFDAGGRLPYFLVFAPLLLLVWRLGIPGAGAGMAVVSGMAALALAQGHGAFQGGDRRPGEAQLLLQLFLLFLSGICLTGAALLTGRQRLERALRESEAESTRQAALLKVVLASMEQGMAAFDRTGRLVAFNRRYQEHQDLPDSLVVPGTSYLAITGHLAAQGGFGTGAPDKVAAAWLQDALSGTPRHFTRTTPDGRTLEVLRRPLPDGGFVNTYTDITERVRREQRLAESEASFRLLAENSGDVVTRIGLDGVRHYVSPAALRVLHWPPEALRGQDAQDLVHPEDRSWVASAMAALTSGEAEETTVTYRFLRPDGSHGWVEARARLIRDPASGEPKECIATLRDATDRKAAEEQLLGAFEQMEAMALTDPLTGLANRRRFDEATLREWRRAARDGTALSLLLVDADRFKAFNDRYGHAAGDGCLAQLAVAMEGAARRPGDLAARFGGEEFVMLLPGTDRAGALEVAERLRHAVEEAGIPHEGNPPRRTVTISIGTATVWPQPDQDLAPDALLRAADEALYAAKDGGRNQVRQASTPLTTAA